MNCGSSAGCWQSRPQYWCKCAQAQVLTQPASASSVLAPSALSCSLGACRWRRLSLLSCLLLPPLSLLLLLLLPLLPVPPLTRPLLLLPTPML